MKQISKHILSGILLLSLFTSCDQEHKKAEETNRSADQETIDVSEKVIFITLDGLRWQEVFTGVDSLLLYNETFTKGKAYIEPLFWDDNAEQRRKKLMPFLWNITSENGFLIGDRTKGSYANLTNTYWFSYPGYNEILTGKADDERINSNDKIPNPNQTILELANEQAYKGQVAAFGSWDRFKSIINEERSGVPVNDGYNSAEGKALSENEVYLNHLQKQAIKPWGSVRQDVFTHNFALEYMKRNHPKLVYISYGETDDFAHDGDYTHYILSAKNTDEMIKELWEYCQKTPFYKDKTTFIITTDHGRGTVPIETWKHHGNKIKGSDQVWIAGFGSKIKKVNSKDSVQYYTNQIAPTVATILKINYEKDAMGEPLYDILTDE